MYREHFAQATTEIEQGREQGEEQYVSLIAAHYGGSMPCVELGGCL